MKKTVFLPGNFMAVIFSVILAGFVSLGSLMAQTVVTSLTIGAQTGSVTYGTPGSVVFPISFSKSGSGTGATNLNIVWTAPSGVTTSFPIVIDPATATSPVALTISTSIATLAGTYSCAVSSTSNAFTSAQANFVVGVKPLTIAGAAASNKVYDRTNSAIITGSLSGVVGTDVITLNGTGVFASLNAGIGIAVTSTSTLSGAKVGNYSLVQPTGLTANFTNALVGNGKSITVTGYTLTGSASSNYSITQPAGLTANITPKTITITGLTGVNRAYDATTSASVTGDPALSGVVTGDSGNVVPGGSPVFVFATASVGTGKPITVTGYIITGSASGNYSLTQPTGIFANITARALTIASPVANNKTYDATNAAIIAGVLSGIVGADIVTLNGTGIFASTNVGTGIAVISTSTLAGASAGNYSLTQPTGLTANITAKALTIASPAAVNKPYDGTNAATITGTLSGIAGTDAVTLTGTGTFSSVNVGNGIPVTSTSTLAGAGAANYTLTQPAGLTANITPREITITGLAGGNKTYDGTTTATVTGTPGLSGVLPADGPNVNLVAGTPVYNFATSSAGNGKAIIVTGYSLSGSAAGNYSLVQPTGLVANILAKDLTVTGPTAADKAYSATNAATITGELAGKVGADVVTLIGTGTFASVNVGTAIDVTSTSTLGGAQAGNYTLKQPTGLKASITPKALTITATGPPKVYGTSLLSGPSSLYFTTTATAGSELVTSVTLRPNTEGLLAGTPAGSAYLVTPTLATGTGGFLTTNYNINYVVYSGTVSPKPITVTAKSGLRKLLGTGDPVFTYTCTPALVGGDVFTGALSRAPGETVEGSPYAITIGTLYAGTNYSITFESSTFTITSASEALITAFNFTALPNYAETIDQITGSISIPVINTTNIVSLIAVFTASPGAVVKVGTVVQNSGVTSNNFSGVVNYVVTSANGLVSKTYAVSVNKNPVATEKQILTFSFPEIPGSTGVINQTDYTVTVHVPLTYNVTSLVATFSLSPVATAFVGGVLQTSGVSSNNFTTALPGGSGFAYSIHAENGSTRNYYVNLVRDPARTEKQLLTYALQGMAGAIDEIGHTIEVSIPHSYNLTNLVATFTSSLASTVRIGSTPQISGATANNFSSAVAYTVVAENGTTQNYFVDVIQLPSSSAKQIIAFQFLGLTKPAVGVIDHTAGTILDSVPHSADITHLVATFVKSPLSMVTLNGDIQTSGITFNDFSSPVVYKVTAEDGSEKNYTVQVTQLPASKENKLLTFSVGIDSGTANGTINEAEKSVIVEVPERTNIVNLVATFTVSPFASVKIGEVLQTSGSTHNDFTLPKAYKIIAEDGSTEIYNVLVRVRPTFFTFSFDDVASHPAGIIDSVAHTIVVHVPFSVDKSALKAYFTVSGNSQVYIGTTLQTTGVTPNNFTTPKIYTLNAQNGSSQNYTVSVISDLAKTENKILSFAFNALTPPCTGVIVDSTKTVSVNVPYGTSVTSLVATYSLSDMAVAKIGTTAQTSGVTPNNFSANVIYSIVAENGSIQNYTVKVIVAPNHEKKILSFQLLGFPNPVVGVIDEAITTVTLHVPFATNVTNLIASFTLSVNAIAKVSNVLQVSGVTPNNFTSTVTYAIYAQNGSFINYYVSVIVDLNNQKKLLTFSFDDISPKPVGIIDEANFVIRVGIPFSVSRASLRAFYTVSAKAKVYINNILQESGITSNSFTADTVLYKVVAEDLGIQNYKVVVRNNPIERGKEIISYNFNSLTPQAVGSIDGISRFITVHVPFNTNVSSLIATFTASPRARLNIGTIEQISGVTINNYTNPLTIVVTAEDATTQNYVVSVILDPSGEKQILDFRFQSLAPQVIGIINETAKRVDLAVPFGTNVTSLVATFTTSANSTVKIGTTLQYSGISINNFTNSLIYQVVAQNGTTQNYTVVVAFLPNTEKRFLTFQVDNLLSPAIGVINEAAHTIQVSIPFSVSRTSLIVSYTVSVNANVFLDGSQQTSPGLPVNFSTLRTYTVRAQDGSIQTYAVSVINSPPESGNTILSFKFAQLIPEVECVIDQSGRTITGTVPYGTNLTNLVASFTKSYLSAVTIGSTIQQSGITANNFTNSVIYKCTAENGIINTYTVIISVQAPSTSKEITYFAFEDLSPVCIGSINQASKTISVDLPFGTNASFLRATFFTGFRHRMDRFRIIRLS
ncbi:MAG: YDG domain-containing protein [Bacteroidia bacterium]|nr:YDG domain-containing protein [Bacteroidia bacterium]